MNLFWQYGKDSVALVVGDASDDEKQAIDERLASIERYLAGKVTEAMRSSGYECNALHQAAVGLALLNLAITSFVETGTPAEVVRALCGGILAERGVASIADLPKGQAIRLVNGEVPQGGN